MGKNNNWFHMNKKCCLEGSPLRACACYAYHQSGWGLISIHIPHLYAYAISKKALWRYSMPTGTFRQAFLDVKQFIQCFKRCCHDAHTILGNKMDCSPKLFKSLNHSLLIDQYWLVSSEKKFVCCILLS